MTRKTKMFRALARHKLVDLEPPLYSRVYDIDRALSPYWVLMWRRTRRRVRRSVTIWGSNPCARVFQVTMLLSIPFLLACIALFGGPSGVGGSSQE